MRVQRICAWCNTVLGEKECDADSGTTHGICVPCAERLLAGPDEEPITKEVVVMVEKCGECGHYGKGQCAIFGRVASSTRACFHKIPNMKRDGKTPIKPSFTKTGEIVWRTRARPPKRKAKARAS